MDVRKKLVIINQQMLNSYITVGKKLREDKLAVEFLPFVELAEVKEIKDSKGKIKQEKPKVIIYDVSIDNEEWIFNKSNDAHDENIKPLFIKGDNNDRFYIAGDINSSYLGGKCDLQGYFNLVSGKRVKDYIDNTDNKIDAFITQFRGNLSKYIKDIEREIQLHVAEYHNKVFIKFKFTKGEEIFYWNDLYQVVEDVGRIIINTCYLEILSKKQQAIRSPVSYYRAYNLNTLQNLDQSNSYKNFDVSLSNEPLINLIVAEKYLSNKIGYFGKVLIQAIPVGEYDRKSLLSFLGKNVLERDIDKFEEENNTHERNPFEILDHKGIFKYDVLFLNKGSQTTDVIAYISSINHSDIEQIKLNWKKAKASTNDLFVNDIQPQLSPKVSLICIDKIEKIQTPFYPISNLLKGFSSKDKKLTKYQLFALYRIFRKQYYFDSAILKGFLEKIEHGLRNEDDFKLKYLLLYLDFIYVNFIFNSSENQLMQMERTESYKSGVLLGTLARNIDQVINSFSKQYAGNISRRVSTKEDLQKLLNFIQEKLVMHDKAKYTRQVCTELNTLLSNFNEPYKKDYVVAGFFYSYMMPFKKTESVTNIEAN